MRRKALVAAALLLTGAGAGCGVTRSYEAEPVVSGDDARGVKVTPENQDEQRCFMIVAERSGWNYSDNDLGIACLVERPPR